MHWLMPQPAAIGDPLFAGSGRRAPGRQPRGRPIAVDLRRKSGQYTVQQMDLGLGRLQPGGGRGGRRHHRRDPGARRPPHGDPAHPLARPKSFP